MTIWNLIAAESWIGYVETHSAGPSRCALVEYRPQVEPSGEPQDWYSIYFALPTPAPIRGYRRPSPANTPQKGLCHMDRYRSSEKNSFEGVVIRVWKEERHNTKFIPNDGEQTNEREPE